MTRRIVAWLLCMGLLVGGLPAVAAAEMFEVEDGVLVRYHGTDARVEVPDGVTAIGETAFRGSR